MYMYAQNIDVHVFQEELYANEKRTIVACAGHIMMTIYCALRGGNSYM